MPHEGLSLPEETDYLYCDACRIHVPCRRLESGGWEVLCPGCVGECAFCQCHLKKFCFGSREQFPPLVTTDQEGRVCLFKPKGAGR